LISNPVQSRTWQWTIQAVILATISLYIYEMQSQSLFNPILNIIEVPSWHRIITRPSLVWTYLGVLLLLFRTLLWLRYRAYPAAEMQHAPFLTVVIPAYNEGEMVAKSIESVAAAQYPRDRLEIFVIDDGSRDDTWEFIVQASERHPDLVTAVRFARNQGKRAALAEGFRKARGEIVITIDSDSVIESGTLLAMVGPFRHPEIGAVAGKVSVYNRSEGFIPRMLHVRFTLSFDFLRAAQSTYGTVYCCPGALAAYRTSVVRLVLDRWINQTFLGGQCTFGEDRALTNYILEQDYDSVYQRTAVVHTIVPATYKKLCKMFLRWDRSYVREEFRLGAIAWNRSPASRLITLVDILVTNIAYLLGYASLMLFLSVSVNDHRILTYMLAGIGLTASLNILYYLRAERSWDFIYGIFYAYYSFFTMFWILPYAALTVRSKAWLTR
jgi:hyaluronan synthase